MNLFADVEEAMVNALRDAFQSQNVQLPGGIYRAIGQEDISKRPPLKFPAIRVFFVSSESKDYHDLSGKLFLTKMTFQVVLFFKSFNDQNADKIYPYLLTIINALKNFQTPKGELKPSKVSLAKMGTYLVYICNFYLETVL